MRIVALLLPAAVLVAPDGTQGCRAGSTVVTVEVTDELAGTVVGPCLSPAAEVAVRDSLDSDVRTFEIHEPCSVRAYRKDGALRIRSEPVEVTPSWWGRRHVEVPLPAERLGGIGVSFERTRDGIGVVGRLVGSPASEQLLDRDVIVSIAGESTSRMSSWGFIDRGTGTPGTMVAIEILRFPGEELLIERAYLPDDAGFVPSLAIVRD